MFFVCKTRVSTCRYFVIGGGDGYLFQGFDQLANDGILLLFFNALAGACIHSRGSPLFVDKYDKRHVSLLPVRVTIRTIILCFCTFCFCAMIPDILFFAPFCIYTIFGL